MYISHIRIYCSPTDLSVGKSVERDGFVHKKAAFAGSVLMPSPHPQVCLGVYGGNFTIIV